METFSIVDKINVDKLNTKIAEFVYRELPLPTLDFYRLVNIDSVLELGLVDHLYKFQESFCPLTYITMCAVGAYRLDCAFSHCYFLSAAQATASSEKQ